MALIYTLLHKVRSYVYKLASSLWRQVENQTYPHKYFHQLDKLIAAHPPRTPGQISILGWNIEYVDADNLKSMLMYQVFREYNDFISYNKKPYILDCGSNIGISVLRFKQLYPQARIIAFEADAEICNILRRNVERNHLQDITVINKAVWTENGSLQFHTEGVDAGRIVQSASEFPLTSVPSVDLRDYLEEPIDLIKLDIEGAEYAVLRACQHKLDKVKAIIVECHYNFENTNEYLTILNILSIAGFRVAIYTSSYKSLKHIISTAKSGLYDQVPVVLAWRHKTVQ